MCKQTLMATARFAYPRRQARLTGVRVNAQLLRDITICTRETPVLSPQEGARSRSPQLHNTFHNHLFGMSYAL